MAAKKRPVKAAPVVKPVVEPEPAAEPEPADGTPEGAEEPSVPRPPARGMTTEQIRRIGTRIAEHEQDLKDNNTSRR